MNEIYNDLITESKAIRQNLSENRKIGSIIRKIVYVYLDESYVHR